MRGEGYGRRDRPGAFALSGVSNLGRAEVEGDVLTVLLADDTSLTYRIVHTGQPLDVLFDGHRVWSIDPADHVEAPDGTRRVDWPAALATRLDGQAEVALRWHGSDQIATRAVCSFGSGNGPVDLTDDNGRLLSLSKWGRLNQSFADLDPALLDWYLDRADEVLTILSSDLGLPSFLAYGSLLGAVRSGHLIGHDMDIDLAYVSEATTPADAMLESFTIERHLRDLGWWLRRQNGGFLQVFFDPPGGGWRNVDIFTMFLDPSVGRLYGLNDTAHPASIDDILPLGTVSLEGRSFPSPRRADVLLEAAYGPSWRVPDPNFSYGLPPGKRQMKDWFSGYRRDRDLWTQLYRQQPDVVPRVPTSFAPWALAQVGQPGLIIDAGSGMGRDTMYYADHVDRAVGLDGSGSGIRRSRRRARRTGSRASFYELNLCSLRDTAVAGAHLARTYPRSRVIVARHLIDAMSPTGQPNFWALCAMLLNGGGRCVLQFVTDEAHTTFREFPGLPCRPVDAGLVAEQAHERGGRVVVEEPTEDSEGPACRMVIEWA